jgi:hypothetical protein
MTIKLSRNIAITSTIWVVGLWTIIGSIIHTTRELYVGPVLVAKPGNLAIQFGLVALSIMIVMYVAMWAFFKFLLWLRLRPLRSELRALEKAVKLEEEKWKSC